MADSPLTPEQEIIRAGKAREILEHELFKEAVEAIREGLKDARLNSAATAIDLREKLWAQELALEAVLKHIRTHIETGMLAEEELRRKSLLEDVKSFFN